MCKSSPLVINPTICEVKKKIVNYATNISRKIKYLVKSYLSSIK